jgi:hypothetical protein
MIISMEIKHTEMLRNCLSEPTYKNYLSNMHFYDSL